MTVTGSCHCGAVAYTLDEPAPTRAMACNCSLCRRRGTLLHFTTPAAFAVTGREALSSYAFNTRRIAHLFCATCGVAVFSEGIAPSGQPSIALNLRTADGIDPDALEIGHFDGAAL